MIRRLSVAAMVFACALVSCSVPAFDKGSNAEWVLTRPADFRPSIKPQPPVPVSDFALVNVPCYGPGSLVAPPLQPAFTGVFESLSNSGDQLDYVQGPGNSLVTVNLRLGVGTWSTGEFQLAGTESSRIVPLYEPGTGTANQIGLVKLCSPTFNYCRELHVRAVVGGQVVVPDNGADLQRFAAINSAGAACQF